MTQATGRPLGRPVAFRPLSGARRPTQKFDRSDTKSGPIEPNPVKLS
jgi:hypothetical protein